MTWLKKIEISNIRRFGEDVSLDLDQNANIIVAPNGTGKTALFEAIELALTGSVERLGDKLKTALIREGFDSSMVKLLFDEDISYLYETSRPKPWQYPLVNGIFGTDLNADAPFLLKLSHLLSQRGGTDWFVSSNENEAGGKLSKLPLGKDLDEALEKVKKAQDELKTRITKNSEALVEIQEKRDEFEELVSKRDEQKTQLSDVGAIRSLKEILEALKDEAEKIDLLTEELKLIENFDALNIGQGKLKDQCDRRIYKLKDVKDQLDKLAMGLKSYELNVKLVEELSGKVNELEKSIEESKKVINNLQPYIEQLQNEKKESEETLNKLNTFKILNSKISEKRIETEQQEKAQIEAEKEIIQINSKLDPAKADRDQKQKLNDQHESFDAIINLNRNELKRIGTLKESAQKWSESDLSIKEKEDEIKKLESNLQPFLDQQKEHDSNLKNTQKSYNTTKAAYDLLAKVSGEISAAVSIISEKILSEDWKEKECPVCLTEFESSNILKYQVNKALKNINPELEILNGVLENQLLEINSAKSQLDETETSIKIVKEKLQALKSEIETIQKEIADQIQPSLPQFDSSEAALASLQQQARDIEAKIDAATSSKKELSPIDTDELSKAKITYEQLKQKHDDESTKKVIVEERIGALNSEILALQDQIEKLALELKTKNVDAEILTIQNAIAEKIKALEGLNGRAKNENQKIEDAEKSIISNRKQLEEYKGETTAYEEQWGQANITKPIKEETLTQEKLKNGELLLRFEDGNSKLGDIKSQLYAWKNAENLQKIESDIKQKLNSAAEDAFIKAMENENKGLTDKHDKLTQQNSVLEKLRQEIRKNREDLIRTHNEMTVPWRGLLRRIVIYPKISQIGLDAKTFRNNPKAKSQLSMNGQPINSGSIASEAQLTDLQLTFQLAMAQRHQWSKWKGLLLDDPTQHHDLVHAAGVFDLLRDYIADLGFQVIMSTHDQTHASFFRRKLENDGISVKTWQLKSGKNGVYAEQY